MEGEREGERKRYGRREREERGKIEKIEREGSNDLK